MLMRYLQGQGVEAVFTRLYEGNRIATLRKKSPLLHALYQGFLGLLNALSLDRRDFGLSDVLLVLQPVAQPAQRAIAQAA